jgi:PAS domain S-box-containing protein
MSRFFPHSLRFRLVVLVLLATLPALLLLISSGLDRRRNRTALEEENLLRLIRLASHDYMQVVDQAHQLLGILSRVPAVKDSESEECTSLFTILSKQYPQYTGFLLLRVNGTLLASSFSQASPISFSDRAWFRDAVQTGNFVVSGYHKGRMSHKPVVICAHPVLETAGRPKAILAVGLDLSWLSHFVAEVGLPELASVTAFDGSGNILSRYPAPDRWIGKNASQTQLFKEIKDRREDDCFKTIDLDGAPMLFAFTHLRDSISKEQSFLSIGMSEEVAFATAERSLNRSLTLMALVMLLALAAALFGGNLFVVHPVNRLLRATKQLAAGNLSERTGIRHGYGELGELGATFDWMAESLQRAETKRRLWEESLTQERAFIESALNTLVDVFIVFDLEGRFQRWNKVVNKVFGYSDAEIRTMKPTDLVSEEDVQSVAEAIELAIKEGYAWVEASVVTKDGAHILYEFSGTLLRDLESKPLSICVIGRDITRRKQAEEALRENEEKFRTLIRTIPDLVWLKDPDGVFLACNARFESLYGAKEKDIIGKTDYDFVDKELADFFREHDKIAMAKGKPSVNEEELTFADDGHREIIETIKTPMYRDDGQLAGVLGVGRNITERVNLQAELVQAQKMESVGRLAGGVAHDYNNVLSVIIGFTELTIDDVDPTGPLRANLEEVLAAANRAKDITRQLLAFARKQTIAPKVLDLNDNVEGMLKMLRRLIGEDIDLVWLPGQSLWPVKMDPSQVDQILANLCVNARDAIEGVGKVTIETDTVVFDADYCADHVGFVPGEFVKLAVSDNGCGMDKGILNNIFEPFFTTKEAEKGTGLGLAMVYGIVKQNNGFINVYSEPGKGTTIKIYLPRHEGKTAEIQGETKAEIPLGRGETVLLVEDDLPILKLARKILDGLGYTVLIAGTPGEALGLAEKHTGEIHLLVTDVIMPEMNGRELAERLQSLCPGLKYLFMSGYTANAIAHRNVLEKGVHFIQKPFSKAELARSVRKALDENKS